MTVAEGLLLACSGFLLAVIWMDLMFDTQVRGVRVGELPDSALASIAAYYSRATTTSRPMSGLIAAVMVVLLGAVAFHALRGNDPVWFIALSAVLAGVPIVLAAVRTVPNAIRLGARSDEPAGQCRLARSIYRDHLLCFASMSAFLVLRLVGTVLV